MGMLTSIDAQNGIRELQKVSAGKPGGVNNYKANMLNNAL